MSTVEIPKTYSSEEVEQKWYQQWEKGGHFKARPGKAGETYSIVMPPPNVTGILHMGHALDVVTQDALIRFKRMKGFETLWLPGMDHAGISTQSVVEKMIFESEGKTRHDLDREDFLARIWKWKEEYGGRIFDQQKRMGASPDWDMSVFTMDPEANEAVKTIFVDLYNEGLIYQADYIVNWDTVLQSAISDAEVEHKEVQGNFYHIKYQVKETGEWLEIATTRPETLLADTAVCVHPEDERFAHLIGKHAVVPLCNREVPIIADEHVDREKGTGCLKVTPGHDFNDFEIGKRHNLPILNMLNKDGTLNELGLEFKGQNVKEARKGVIKKLKEIDQLIDTKPHVHQVGHGEKSKSVIEPLISKQWFLNVSDMAQEAVSAVEKDTTRFYPKGWENTYFSWLREPKNWCISRQLVWGHRIPVYTCASCSHEWAAISEPSECAKCHKKEITQDPDVLDTWFSSGIWPLTMLGWPNKERMKERGFERFYPTSVLITGYDIIFFWVARMMMMGMKATGAVPFHKIYIHAIVRDKNGVKMSKSLGNGIDPLDMIKEYGTDALRFTLAAGSGYNRNLNLDPERIAGYRNFINKIWNAFRFIEPVLAQAKKDLPPASEWDHHERWILSELNSVALEMNQSIEDYRYDDSCSAIYAFVYDKFCSWFIELSKPILYGNDEAAKIRRATVLKYGFRKIVALMHPFTPFITEELWSYLKNDNEPLLISSEYPEFDQALKFEKDQAQMDKFMEVVTMIRNLRSSVNAKPKDEVKVSLFSDDQELKDYLKHNTHFLSELARVKELVIAPKTGSQRPGKSTFAAAPHSEVFLHLEGIVDLDEQLARIQKELEKSEKEMMALDKKVQNKKFMDNAPAEVVAEVRAKAAECEAKITSLKQNIEIFKS